MRIYSMLFLCLFIMYSCHTFYSPYDGVYEGELVISYFEREVDSLNNVAENIDIDTVPFTIVLDGDRFTGDWRKGMYEIKGEHIEFTGKTDYCPPNADCAYYLLTKVDYSFNLQEDSLKMQYDSEWYIDFEEMERRTTQFYKLKR